ncbi:MAG: hypothetical protein ACPL3C_09920 [Pyrobaculum sp.]
MDGGKKIVRKTFTLTQRDVEVLEALVERGAAASLSDAVRRAIDCLRREVGL